MVWQVRVSQQLPTDLAIPYSHPRLNAGQQGYYDDDDDICYVDDSDLDSDDSDFDCDCSHRFIGTQKLSEMLQQPYDLFKPGWADHYILGMVNQVNIWMGHTRNQA